MMGIGSDTVGAWGRNLERVNGMNAFDPFPYVQQVGTAEQFKEAVAEFGENLGFKNFAALFIVDRPGGRAAEHLVHNAPAGYLADFHSDDNRIVDPVMQHLRTRSLPIAWTRETYSQAGATRMWERQADFGYRSGIAVALHLPFGVHFSVGIDTSNELPSDAERLQNLVAYVQLFTVHAQEAAERIFARKQAEEAAPALTPREVEALRWTVEGKTAWEISVILGISERTATAHLNNATHKLGCVNKYVASFRAIRLGLV